MNMIGLVVLLVFVLWFYSAYVTVVKSKNKAAEAFASIDVQLKKRYDLIPNILTLAKKFMEHERSLIEDVTNLRMQAVGLADSYENIDKKIALDKQICKKMNDIMVQVENYPQLKSDQTMVTAMQTYNEVEEHIAAARRFYNSAANELKNAVEIFPYSFFARQLNVETVDFFSIDERERQPINAKDFFN